MCKNLFDDNKKKDVLFWNNSKMGRLIDNLKVPLTDLNNDLGMKKILSNILRIGIGLVTNVGESCVYVFYTILLMR